MLQDFYNWLSILSKLDRNEKQMLLYVGKVRRLQKRQVLKKVKNCIGIPQNKIIFKRTSYKKDKVRICKLIKMPQRLMRQRVQRMSQYQILKDFHFVDLMSLAQFYEERTFIYGEYLYKQGSAPEQIYLIDEGEFQFTKLFEDNHESVARTKLKQKLMHKNKASKQKRIAIDFQDASQYNIPKPAKLKEFRVGTIMGGIGQSIGDEEIILGKQKRLHNAKCTSTHNKVVVIKKQYIIKILNSNQKLLEGLVLELKEKEKVVNKAHKKLQAIRLNMENFVKLVQQQQIFRQNQRTRSTERPESDLKLPFLSKRNQTEIKKKKQSLPLINQQKITNRFSNDSLLTVDKLQKSRAMQSAMDESDQASETFALTAFENSTSALKKKIQQKSKFFNKAEENDMQEDSNYDDYIPLKVSKSWNIKAISPQKLLVKQKYPGMIDSTALIKEKQHILGIKRKNNEIDDRAEFQQRHKKLLKQTQLEKERAMKSSTAHSKQYMEKMLLNALKKAGYQESAPQIQKTKKGHASLTQSESQVTQTASEEPFHLYSEVRQLKTDKITMKLKKKRKQIFEPISEVLERNPFDECYFSNIV